MTRMVWQFPGIYPLVVNGLPAVDPSCCCVTEICGSQINWWGLLFVETPSERLMSAGEIAFYPNFPAPAFGDASNCNEHGGPKRLAYLSIWFQNVDYPRNHTFNNVRLRIKIAFTPFAYQPAACSALINITIVGHDVADSPSLGFDGAQDTGYLHGQLQTARTSAIVPWYNIPKPDATDCGIAEIITPNIASIVNEILARPDWVLGNSLRLFFEPQLMRVNFYSGVVNIKRDDRKIYRIDGGSWLADGIRNGHLVTVKAAGRDDFIACVNTVTADALFWSAVPVWWPLNGNVLMTIITNVTSAPGYLGASRPSTSTWDYIVYPDFSGASHCMELGG